MRLAAAVFVVALLAGHAVCDDIKFDGRRMKQLFNLPAGFPSFPTPGTIPGTLPGTGTGTPQQGSSGRVQVRPAPEGGTIDDWEFIETGSVKGLTVFLFNQIEDPRDALAVAFGELAFSVDRVSPTITRLTLNSGRQITIEQTGQGISRPGLFHLFKITGHGSGIVTSGGTDISIVGSQFFIQISGISSATVEIGWLGSTSPSRFSGIVSTLFEGIVEDLVDRFKSLFRGNDCVRFGPDAAFRDISGVCNNADNIFGSANVRLSRIGAPAFGNGQNSPGGSTISPRLISNIVCKEDSSSDDGANAMRVTDLLVFFGQFIDHDIGISPVGAFAAENQPLFATSFVQFREELPIPIPSDDPDFTIQSELPFERAVHVRENNAEVLPREIVNEITSFLDLSQVYGSTASRARALRSFSGGTLRTGGPNFLPFNGPSGVGISLDNAEDASDRFYVAGDIRSNENVNLLVMHTIWLREHNRVASEIRSVLPDYNDELLYETARAIVTAEYQSILYTEWLPLLLGSDSPSASSYRYNSGIDASADIFFTTVSFRFGHTMINGKLWRVNAGQSTPAVTVNLRDVFFKPEVLTGGNFDSWVRGMMWHQAREADELVIDDLRTFLFTPDGAASADLVSLNIQRARDMGVPTYNAARGTFGLPPLSFSGISQNPTTVANLQRAYGGDVNIVDAFVGGLAETTPPGRLFGDLFHSSIKDQFTKLRDGDRFFYKGLVFDPRLVSAYPRLNTIINDGVKMIDVMTRNSGVTRGDLGVRGSAFQL